MNLQKDVKLNIVCLIQYIYIWIKLNILSARWCIPINQCPLGVRLGLWLVVRNVVPGTTKDVDPDTCPTFVIQCLLSAAVIVSMLVWVKILHIILYCALLLGLTWLGEDLRNSSQPGADSSDNEQQSSVRSSHQSVSSTQNRSITKYDLCASCQQCDWYYPQGTFKSYWMVFLCLHWMHKFNIFDRREQEKPSCRSFYRCRNTDPKKNRSFCL